MSRKKATDLEQTRVTLLSTGLMLFERKGYNATGIQEITDQAGVPKGSFYNYFASKEDFCVEVIRFYAQTHLSEWGDLLTTDEGKEPYLALTSVFVDLASRYECAQPKRGCLLGNLAGEISEVSEECRLALQEAANSFKQLLTQRLRCGQAAHQVRDDLPAERLADLIWDAWQGSLLRMRVEASVNPVRNTLDLLFQTMLKPLFHK